MKANWRKVKLGDAIKDTIDNRGKNPPEFFPEGIPVIDNFQITGNRSIALNLSKRFLNENLFKYFIRKHIEKDDLLITLVGNGFGNVALAPKEKSVIIQNTIGLRCNQQCTNLFLFYFLSLNKNKITELNRGVAQPSIKVGDLLGIQLVLPSVETQNIITSILSAYDDLIEANQKCIKILEEMAQLLYTEWFVKFKFPGYKKVKMVDSGTEYGMIPVGWEIKNLNDICIKITDGSHYSPGTVKNGLPMASVKDMHNYGINIDTCRKISNKDFEDLVKSDCYPLINDILIAKDGSYLKHIFVIEEQSDFVILSSIAILRPNGQFLPNLLSLYLKQPHIKTLMKGYVSGAAIPRIVLKDFKKFKIVVPPKQIQSRWSEICDSSLTECKKLYKENNHLKKLRDLLIPELITGKREIQ